MADQYKDVGIRFKGLTTITHIVLPRMIYDLIQGLIDEKKYRSHAQFLRKAAGMALLLLYDINAQGAELVDHINEIVDRGDFSRISHFYDFASRLKLIQMQCYPNIKKLGYAFKMWFKGWEP